MKKKRAPQKGDPVPSYPAGGEDVHLDGLPSFSEGSLHTDALRDLPYQTVTGMWTEASGAHLLCGQPVCIEPLPYVKNMYYLDVNFYRYYIGRQDQSVNETVMISRIDQQIRVTKLMIDYLVGRKSERGEKPTSVPVHAQLSGDHHGSIFRTVDPPRYHRTSGEKERTVGVPERKRTNACICGCVTALWAVP